MNFIYVTAQRRNKLKEDHRSKIRNLYSCEKKSLKKRMYWIRGKNGPWQVSNICSEGYALTPCATRKIAIMVRVYTYCTGIAELRVPIPANLNIFFRLSFRSCISCTLHCDDLHFISILILLLPIKTNNMTWILCCSHTMNKTRQLKPLFLPFII